MSIFVEVNKMAKNIQVKLPLIPLRGITVFPNMIVSFAVGRQKSIDALDKAMQNDETVYLVGQRDSKMVDPKEEDLFKMGTVAKVKQVLRLPGNMTHIIVEGLKRAKLIDISEETACLYADVKEIEQDNGKEIDDECEAMIRLAMDAYEDYTTNFPKSSGPNDAIINVVSISKPGQMADVIAAGITLSLNQKQTILETTDPIKRLELTYKYLNHELDILKLKKSVEVRVKVKMERAQKEYFLREQIKIIQEELGDKDGIQADVDKFNKKLEQKQLLPDAKEHIQKEIERLSRLPLSSPESGVIRSYIEYVLELPWSETTKESLDIKKSERILECDHYGLEKVKQRILEFLAVRQNAPELSSPIICLVGPPGVGKTSIVKSMAKALNRNYVRMSLGGVKDEAEIRGHRKTYVGAMAGRIISSMKQSKTINPLMLLDEIDKLSTSYNGDPAAALLEVLDSEQNNTFRDHYLEINYDLSQVLFVCTANTTDTIPSALRDRMEIIHLSSYTSEEKLNIAINHLYPKQLKKHGLKKGQLKIDKNAVSEIISGYTREAGVRQLERVLGEICRKAVKSIMMEETSKIVVTEKNIEKYLGIKKYKYDKIYDVAQSGIVRGLAWTQVGGDTLSIEVNTMKGTGKFELTGNMGEVMKESAMAAISYIRSCSDNFKIQEDFYKEKDIHIHIPEGAVPKDGPSAGITMATAMVSALTGALVRNDVAMTGEITIRGHVLPIGGLKEKVIAAKRAGITKIIVPYENEKDLSDIPDNIKQGIEFVFAKEMAEVLDNALIEGESIWR